MQPKSFKYCPMDDAGHYFNDIYANMVTRDFQHDKLLTIVRLVKRYSPDVAPNS